MGKKKVYTNPSENCDLCKRPIVSAFVDGKTRNGPWANMCLGCHRSEGVGLGEGKGQQYQLDEAGDYVKVAG